VPQSELIYIDSRMQHDEKLIATTFDKIWKQTPEGELDLRDAMSIGIFEVLKKEIGSLSEKRILEAGSGTGRVSLCLAQSGAVVSLLDISWHALRLSRAIFCRGGKEAGYIRATIFQLPYGDAVFDVVWNAGVLEHFLFEDQVLIMKELARVTRPDGLIITLNPSHFGKFYRLAKWLRERIGRWTFGRETPVKSFALVGKAAKLSLLREYDALFEMQFDLYGPPGRLLRNLLTRMRRFNPLFLRMFGGYLRVSVLYRSPGG